MAKKRAAGKGENVSHDKDVVRSSKPRVKGPYIYECHAYEEKGLQFVVFAAPANDLYSFLKINRRSENKDEGYQRAISMSRVQAIAKFVDSGGVLPTAIYISLNGGFKVDRKRRSIEIPNNTDAGWVIDGQHRLAGSHVAKSNPTLPVVACLDLALDKQIEFFVTINQEGKGVPSSLYYELLPSLPGVKTEKELLDMSATELAKELATDERSPFYGKIVSTVAPQRGRQISTTHFVRRLSGFLKRPSGALHTFTHDERRKILNAYYKALEVVWPDEYEGSDGGSVFFQSLGFGALIGALPQFMRYSLRAHGGYRVADFAAMFKSIENAIDWDSWKGRGTGTSYEAQSAKELVDAIDAAQKDEPPKHVKFEDFKDKQ